MAAMAGAAFLVWKPGVARSMLGSPRALGFTVVVGAAVLGLGWVLPRLRRGPLTTGAAQAVPVLIAFVITVLPAFHDVTAAEAFPAAATGPGSAVTLPAPGSVVLSRGALRGIDHSASGVVLLVQSGDRLVVRLEHLDVEPGPDYQVYLVPGPDRRRPEAGTHLGRLRANRGDLNYAVPSGLASDRPVTVLIWCRAFAVPVAQSTLQ
jgi:Electron transfer DM13